MKAVLNITTDTVKSSMPLFYLMMFFLAVTIMVILSNFKFTKHKHFGLIQAYIGVILLSILFYE